MPFGAHTSLLAQVVMTHISCVTQWVTVFALGSK